MKRRSSDVTRRLALTLSDWCFAGLFLLQAASLFGFGFFVLNPARLAEYPWAPPIFSVSFPLFARAQIAAAFLTIACQLIGRSGGAWIKAFLLCAATSFAAELAGTTLGVPFGAYTYTGLLGYKLLGHVPLLIPLSWFMTAISAHVLATAFAPRDAFSAARVLVGSSLLVTWDLTLDPAMSHLTPFWVWSEPGDYFGMPWVNMVGWAVTSVTIFLGFELLKAHRIAGKIPVRWAMSFYAVNLSLPIGIVALAGLWTPVAFTLGSLGALGLLWCASHFLTLRLGSGRLFARGARSV